MSQFLETVPHGRAMATLVLAHGAGAPMDTPFMTGFAERAAAAGIRSLRFEFAYMAERRQTGRKRPPPRADKLIGEFEAALVLAAEMAEGPLLAGGKSLGGRVAAMLGGEQSAIAAGLGGVVCLGYPFHPPGKPERLRLAPLEALRVAALICQGERDPFGTREDVAGYDLGERVSVAWMRDGNHDLAPRKASGTTQADNLDLAAHAAADFAARIAGR